MQGSAKMVDGSSNEASKYRGAPQDLPEFGVRSYNVG